jgi:RHS repeat-associated protein
LYRSGKFLAVHTDHLGTPRKMVDNANQTVWQWPYSAFGDNAPTGILKPTTSAAAAFVSLPAQAGSGTTTASLLALSSPTQINNLRMPGQYFDKESNLHYNYYRSYQATQGRYTQNDPIGLAGGWNRFGYVEGNPLMYADPYGLDKTVWRFPSGPTNGNWGGRCWSGGQYACGDKGPGNLPPTDSADACYKNHDVCYSACPNPNDMQCRAKCNKQLVDELRQLPNDPRQWPMPPIKGTERDSVNFRNRALGYYGGGIQ